MTNDDGYDAAGLQALVSDIKDRYRVVVAAPMENQSGMGRAVRLRRPISVEEYLLDGVKTYAVSSTPATAVILALSYLLEQQPNLVVSGINNGENLSPTVLRSGTFGAALEGRMYGISSLAVSIARPVGMVRDEVDFGYAPKIAARFIEELLTKDGPHLLNVNIPYGASLDTEVCIAEPSRREMDVPMVRQENGVYIIDTKKQYANAEPMSDADLLMNRGKITATYFDYVLPRICS